MSTGPEWLRQLFKRNPLGEQLTVSADVGNAIGIFAPPAYRAAFCTSDLPGAALEAGGMTYFPGPEGGVIERVWFGADQAPNSGRMGILTMAQFQAVTIGLESPAVMRPVWPTRPLRGQVFQHRYFGLGDLGQMPAVPFYCEPNIIVMPGNVFCAALVLENTPSEFALWIREFVADDDLNT